MSATEEPTGGYEPEDDDPTTIGRSEYTAALDGERFGGYGLSAELDRSARHWNFEFLYRAVNPTFRTANGFNTRSDYHRFSTFQIYNFYPKRGFADVISPFLSMERQINFDGVRKLETIRPALNMQLKGQTYTHVSYRFSRERFRGMEFGGLRTWAMEVNSSFSNAVGAGAYLYAGTGIARNEDVPEKGRFLEAGGFVNLKPTPRLQMRPSINFARMRRLDSGESFYNGWIMRAQLNYQFTRELSLRLITQYNRFDKRFHIEPLLSYQISPFTVLYVGSTYDYGIYDSPYGVTEAGRHLFFKVQYLFQR